ncbi:MAG: cytochrome c [Gammaproteobacteria bacterium]|nr:cytochrome c [Gammaproteobacteria bacterium]
MSRILLVLFVAVLASGALAADGDALYRTYCSQCHGITGHGNGINAPHMSVVPRDHTNASEMGKRSDEDLFKVVAEGGSSMNQSILMPAWSGLLEDDDLHALIRHMRALCCE